MPQNIPDELCPECYGPLEDGECPFCRRYERVMNEDSPSPAGTRGRRTMRGDRRADGGRTLEAIALDDVTEGDQVRVTFYDHRSEEQEQLAGEVVQVEPSEADQRRVAWIIVASGDEQGADAGRYRIMFGGGVSDVEATPEISLGYRASVAREREVATDGGNVSADREQIDRHGRQANHPDEFRAETDEVEIFDPGLALGFFRRLEVLLEASPVKIYTASSLKHPWPYRIQNAAECYPASFWRSQDRIMDSAIGTEISNREVLDHAIERHATAVVAKDYLHDQAATTESIREFINLHDPKVHPRAYIPLQPPYDEHAAEVYPLVEASPLEHRYMLGGLKDATPTRRLRELFAFRDAVGKEPVAHGLGWGLDDELVAAIRDHPALLDSVDNSTPSQALRNGRIVDKHWRSRAFAVVESGEYQNVMMGGFEFACLVQAVHRLTPYNDEFLGGTQRTVGEFEEVAADD